MTQRYYAPFQTAFDDSGNIIAGAKLETFEAGTSNPLATFTDPALTTPHSNPVLADASGRFPDIYLARDTYKFVLKDADDVIIRTSDDYDNESTVSSTEDNIFTGNITMNGSVINEDKGADIPSAATTDLGSATGNTVTITGTTTITSFGIAPAGAIRRVIFADILTLTHNATSLILPTEANITTQAGDVGVFVSLGSANWKTISYERQDGTALTSSAIVPTVLQSITSVIPAVTASTTIPNDDTTPLVSEGTEIVSQAITPDSASNKVRLVATVSAETQNNAENLAMVAFRDSTAIGAAVAMVNTSVDNTFMLTLNLEDSPASASSVTYTLRVGKLNGAGAWWVNRKSTPILNGEMAKNAMTLEEIKV